MECAHWEDEYTMRGRLGSGCTRSPVHSLLCSKLEKQVLLPLGATWRQGSRKRPLYVTRQLCAQKILEFLLEITMAIVVARLRSSDNLEDEGSCLFILTLQMFIWT